MKTLAEMKAASRCRVIEALRANPALQGRLYALGLYPGVELSVLRFAPAGDPMQVRVGGTLLSIRKREAQYVTVEELGADG